MVRTMPTILTIATNNLQLKRISGSSRSSEVVGLVGVVSFQIPVQVENKRRAPKARLQELF